MVHNPIPGIYPKAIHKKKKTSYILENVHCSSNKGASSLLVQFLPITFFKCGIVSPLGLQVALL